MRILFLIILCSMAALAAETPTRVTLPNGLPLIVQDTYSSPTVSLNIFIRVGSVHEPQEVNGIAHFYEHMFFRGTPTRSGLEFKRQIEALGGTTNAQTTRDFTHFYINMPRQYLKQGLELLADAYKNAECAQSSVDAERDVVLEEYRIGKDNPGRIISDKLYSMVFKNHPYGRSIIGTEERIRAITRNDLLNWKATYYVPSRTSLVIVGEVDRNEVVSRCTELFGHYRPSGGKSDKFDYDAPPAETQQVVEEASVGQTYLVLGYLGPSVKDRPDVYQVDMLTFLLGIGKGSMLGKALSAADGEQVQCGYLTQAYPGLITITAVADPKEEDEVKAKIEAVLQRVQNGDFTEAEVARARTLLTTSYRFGAESNAGKAENLGFYETIDRMNFATTYLAEVKKVTKADIVAAARKYLGRNHYNLVLRAPRRNS